MAPKSKKNRNRLTPSEQKTTTAFKLLSERNKTLERSLKTTQDELELYREKYYKADKDHAVQVSKNSTLVLHEILKFIISTVCGGVGVNLITLRSYGYGIGVILAGIVLYTIVSFFDRK